MCAVKVESTAPRDSEHNGVVTNSARSPSLNVPCACAPHFPRCTSSLCIRAGLSAELGPDAHRGPAFIQHMPWARPELSPPGCLINAL